MLTVLCRSNNTLCDGDTSGSGGYLALFIIGRLLMGVGATPLYTSGVTFMDDCLKKSTFSLFVGMLTFNEININIGFTVRIFPFK